MINLIVADRLRGELHVRQIESLEPMGCPASGAGRPCGRRGGISVLCQGRLS